MIDKLDGISNKPNSAIKAGYSSDQGTGSIRLRSGLSLPELQCMLDENGATDLVIDLIISEPSHIVFFECLHLAIALLEGGNSAVQVNIGYFWLSTNIVLVFLLCLETLQKQSKHLFYYVGILKIYEDNVFLLLSHH